MAEMLFGLAVGATMSTVGVVVASIPGVLSLTIAMIK